MEQEDYSLCLTVSFAKSSPLSNIQNISDHFKTRPGI